jgi:hypothetical protein
MAEETNGLITSLIVSLVWTLMLVGFYLAIQTTSSVHVLSQCCATGPQELVAGSHSEIVSVTSSTEQLGHKTPKDMEK